MKQSVTLWIVLLVTGLTLGRFFSIVESNILIFLLVCYANSRLWKFVIFKRVPRLYRFENNNQTTTAIVTGASSGIGSQIAVNLWKKGAKVIWTARDVKKAQSVVNDVFFEPGFGPRGYVMHLDLASLKSIEEFVRIFKSKEQQLNLLVLNAAYHGPKRLTSDGFEQSIGVNHLGHMYLCYLLLNLLKKNAPGRIIILASDLHRFCKEVRLDDLMYEQAGSYKSWTAYNHSKLLNILFVKELSRRLAGKGITVHAAHPGTPVVTELMRDDIFMGSAIINHLILRPLSFLFCRSTEEGAQTPLYCSLAPECCGKTGLYFENCRPVNPSLLASDAKLAGLFWDKSCDLLKIDRNWC